MNAATGTNSPIARPAPLLVAACIFLAALSCAVPTFAVPAFAEPAFAEPDRGAEPGAPQTIAATVNGEPVFVKEVEHELARVIGTRRLTEDARRTLQATALAQWIDRRLILQWLGESQRAATAAEIDLAVERFARRLAERQITLEDHLARQDMDLGELRRLHEWKISWQRFLDRYLTDENLTRFFNDHRRDYDGTRIRVAHLLLKAGDDPASLSATIERAARLRKDIQAGKLTFAEAAAQHSAAPTAQDGGELGLIARHEPMTESFSRAAFALELNEISAPVTTAFGVHLIRCLEIKPGERKWEAARDELTKDLTAYLFRWAAGRRRSHAEIEFTGALPHFAPGTQTLAD